MARSRQQRQTPDAVSVYKAHADAAREHRANAKSETAQACFGQAIMCHDTADRIAARAAKLSNEATNYRAASLFAAQRNPRLAAHLTNRANDCDAAVQAIPDHISKWHNRGLEHSARGHEQEKAFKSPDNTERHNAWLKHLNLPLQVPEANAVQETKPRATRNAGAQE